MKHNLSISITIWYVLNILSAFFTFIILSEVVKSGIGEAFGIAAVIVCPALVGTTVGWLYVRIIIVADILFRGINPFQRGVFYAYAWIINPDGEPPTKMYQSKATTWVGIAYWNARIMAWRLEWNAPKGHGVGFRVAEAVP